MLNNPAAVTPLNLESDDSRASRPPEPLIKVMHIINDLSIGGAEMMLHKLLIQSDRRRFEPVVVSLIDRGALREEIEALGIHVYTARMKPGVPSPLGLWRLVRLMRRLRPDLVLGWMYHSCLAAQLAKLFSFVPARILWSIHYSVSTITSEKRLTAAVIRMCAPLSKLADHLIFVSRASQVQHEPLGYSLNKSCVIPNGIEVAKFVPSPSARFAVRAELGLSEADVIIGVMGRYHPMKDHENFLRAAALLSEKHPEAQFVLVGRGIDSDNQNLASLIRELGISSQTHLLGERHDIPRLAAAFDICALSSYGESFPNVIGEAMSCEVPCVVTDVGDAGLIVGNSGRVVQPRDSAALANAWLEMIELGREGRQALGRAARSRVIELFTLNSVVARYETLYENVLASEATSEFGLTSRTTALPEVG